MQSLGAALQLSGQPAEAAKALERAISMGKLDSTDETATRLFFLGQARAATGDEKAAREAFERAVKAAPASEYGVKAAMKLAAPSA